jgi:penicillin-binding protein 2
MRKKYFKQILQTNIFSAFGKNNKKSVWSENNFVFDEASGKQVATPQGNTYLGTNFTNKKAIFLSLFIILIFLIIIGRLFFIQIIKGEEYSNLAKNNKEKKIPIVAERGQIYDRNNVQLTYNIPNFSLAIMPHKLPRDRDELDIIVKRLAEITEKNEEEIREIIDEFASFRYESIIISEDLDYETALLIQIAAADLPGIHIQRGSKRLYDLDNRIGEEEKIMLSISHILGYQGKLSREDLDELYNKGYIPSDYIGKTGVEKQYEPYLRGEYGQRILEVDAFGKEQSVLSEKAPTPGKHIKLTIDIDIQQKLEEIIQNTLIENEKEKGSAIVINPNNGEILGLVSLPSFNSNDFSGGIDYETYKSYIDNPNNPLFNRAISGSYPSGSTIKPAIASAALQEGLITHRTSFLSTGGISVDPWFFPDWLPGGHGNTNVRKSLAWSVNTFYYYIGGGYKNFTGLGVDKITEYLRLFGLDSELGIDLPSENKGFLPSKEWKEEVKGERWYVGDTYNISIGQGDVLVTPLQIASMTSVIANNGILYKPKVLRSIVDSLTEEEELFVKEVIREHVIDSDHLNTVRFGMKDCVEYGSCRRLLSLPIDVAGKTGTAQWSNVKEPHGWFTSFAPFYNPQIVLTILIEEGESGSDIAVPIAEQFYYWWWYNKAK